MKIHIDNMYALVLLHSFSVRPWKILLIATSGCPSYVIYHRDEIDRIRFLPPLMLRRLTSSRLVIAPLRRTPYILQSCPARSVSRMRGGLCARFEFAIKRDRRRIARVPSEQWLPLFEYANHETVRLSMRLAGLARKPCWIEHGREPTKSKLLLSDCCCLYYFTTAVL